MYLWGYVGWHFLFYHPANEPKSVVYHFTHKTHSEKDTEVFVVVVGVCVCFFLMFLYLAVPVLSCSI